MGTTDLAFRQGVQFVSLGGAGGPGTITVGKLKRFTDEDGAETVKNAGFHGVCFDIELTTGEEDLVEAMEKTFRILKKAGLLVMVTTSHSAPYAASSDRAKNLIVESWVQSNDIDIFSPQLYTSRSESARWQGMRRPRANPKARPHCSMISYGRRGRQTGSRRKGKGSQEVLTGTSSILQTARTSA